MSKAKADRFSRLSPAAVYDTRISGECLRVLAAIAVHVDKNGEGYPSARKLGRRLGCSERSVQHHVKALKAAGYIEVFWRRLAGGKLAGQVVRWFRLKYPHWEEPAEHDEPQADCGSETQADCVMSNDTIRNLDADETQLDRSRTASGLHPMNSPPLNSPSSEQPSEEHARGRLDDSGRDWVSGGRPRLTGEVVLPTSRAQQSSRKKTRGTRLADEAVLSDEWRTIAHERRPDLDPDRLFESFKRYFTGADANRPVKKDWTRAWLNWIERERHGQPGHDQNRGLAAAAFAGAAAALGRSGRG